MIVLYNIIPPCCKIYRIKRIILKETYHPNPKTPPPGPAGRAPSRLSPRPWRPPQKRNDDYDQPFERQNKTGAETHRRLRQTAGPVFLPRNLCRTSLPGSGPGGRAPVPAGKKKLYYISAEFLIGKLLSNNLINLGIYDQVREILAGSGHNLSAVEEMEPEPSLGNGGLGRLAACFLDSIATLGLNGDGVGLNYHSACSNSSSRTTSRRRSPIPGWKLHPGSPKPTRPTPFPTKVLR